LNDLYMHNKLNNLDLYLFEDSFRIYVYISKSIL
jgi:hypothetical protein